MTAPREIKLGSFRKFWLRLPLLLSLFQTYPWAPSVLVDELDPGQLECPSNCLKGRAPWLAYACFQLVYSHYADLSPLSQFLLAPFQQAAGGSAL